ncbi:hypothetical protein C1H46_021495 [Malus baccata]|uniref:Uncharacterized protein n=1 Tax=Malus baccata TaxID=106549 RepID=A0A540M2P0_MALBA|nr:hypothetical protein C1H46_021495 [Malus baccata]
MMVQTGEQQGGVPGDPGKGRGCFCSLCKVFVQVISGVVTVITCCGLFQNC